MLISLRSYNYRRAFFAIIILFMAAASHAATHAARAADHAAVIMYHRFGEDNLPSTSISIEQFEKHLDELTNGNYTIMPLIEITKHVINGTPLPDRAVAITVDDAFASFYELAWPMLKERNLPVTLFVSTQAIDLNLRGYASWAELREMQAEGIHIGSQSHTHPHMHLITAEQARTEIEKSNQQFIKEIGTKPQLFAYPYGEFTPEIRDIIKETGFVAAFGQQSGIMHQTQNHFEFPRFAFNQNYGSLDRLKLAINALAIPATDMWPENMVLGGNNPPLYGFTVTKDIGPLQQIQCFASNIGAVETVVIGKRVETRIPEKLVGKRARINCTMPYFLANGKKTDRWRWIGRQWLP